MIKTYRKQLNMSVSQLANWLGMGDNGERTIRRWEHDDSAPYAVILAMKYCLKYGDIDG